MLEKMADPGDFGGLVACAGPDEEPGRDAVHSGAAFRNDLQAVAVSRFPEIAACLGALSREVPSGVRVGMSGSGSSVFAAFAEEDAAVQTLSRVARAGNIAGFVARTLDRHPLQHFAAP